MGLGRVLQSGPIVLQPVKDIVSIYFVSLVFPCLNVNGSVHRLFGLVFSAGCERRQEGRESWRTLGAWRRRDEQKGGGGGGGADRFAWGASGDWEQTACERSRREVFFLALRFSVSAENDSIVLLRVGGPFQ
jgi:hypothetical protein